jgi:heme iron utilization protein
MTENPLSPAEETVALMAEATAALATLDRGGWPFVSHVIVAQAADRAPLMLLSRLAVHTRNLETDPRASLLFVRPPAPGEEDLAVARLTLTGRCVKYDDAGARERFLIRHPDAARYAGFADFSLYRFDLEAGHLVAGFGRIVSLTRDDILSHN